MTTLDILSEKINKLKTTMEQLNEEKLDDKTRIEAEIVIVEECLEALENDVSIVAFNFDNAVELLDNHKVKMENLSKIISDIQNVIEIRNEMNLTETDMPFSDNQNFTIANFIDNLRSIRVELGQKLEEILDFNDNGVHISNLETLQNILEEKGKRKYVTEDMFESFYEVIDWDTININDAKNLLSAFYNTRNLKGKRNKEKANFEEVLELYKEFLDDKEFEQNENGKYVIGRFGNLLQSHEEEICTFIDIENTKEILQFFKENNLIHNFSDRNTLGFDRTALLKVSIFSNSDYVKELYKKIIEEYPDRLEMYLEDTAATLWVCDKTTYKRRKFRTSKSNSGPDGNGHSLYSECHSVTNDEFWENVELLNNNKDMFSEKYNVDNFGAHLKAKTIDSSEIKQFNALLNIATTSSWSVRKNLKVYRMFGLGNIYKIPISCLENGDVENKVHLAIELGLLNPPMTSEYYEIENNINRNEEFQAMQSKRKIYNPSIRNYFQRYTGYLASLTINDYAILSYEHKTKGDLEFFNDFFSIYKAGQKNPEYIKDAEASILSKQDDFDKFLSEQFATDFYSEEMKSYDEYDSIISNSIENEKSSKIETPYFDANILSDELITKIEANNRIDDLLRQGDELLENPNEFVYIFGNTIISRYKVLKNASILKKQYGYLDEDMLLASIVRNSFLSSDEYKSICNEIKGRNVSR